MVLMADARREVERPSGGAVVGCGLWGLGIVVWVLGLVLAWNIGAMAQGWFHAKLLFVVGLSAYHGWTVAYAKKLARGERQLTGKQLRLYNEVPGIAAAIIVILVVAKPF
jgi:putative membrane protein